MNTREQIIDDFLKFFRDLSLQNPLLPLDYEIIYKALTQLGVLSDYECYFFGYNIEHFFEYWIDHFKDVSNCNVFVEENWNYFCQFCSTDDEIKSSNEHLKVYVPLDLEHIKEGAVEIFEFLSKENISHHSKISKHIRFDDIVIRVINPEDVIKLVDFVKGNKYIQEGLIKCNPFAFNIDNISMAVDGKLSFNTTIAKIIAMYINHNKSNNTLNLVGVNDFYEFIEKYYNKVFNSEEGLKQLISEFCSPKEGYVGAETIVNYKNIFELILKVNKPDFNFNDYVDHYRECSNQIKQKQKIEKILEIKPNLVPSITPNEMLLKIVDGMMEKNGFDSNNSYLIQLVLENINYYLECGDETYITRYNGLRSMVAASTFRQDMLQILNANNLNFFVYAQNLLEKRKQQSVSQEVDEKESETINEKSVISTILEILEKMSDKVGEERAYDNLKNFLNTGNFTMITRVDNLRERVVNSTFRNDLKQILKKRGLELIDYLKMFHEEKTSEFYLEQAILTTYYKYESKFQEGTLRMSGRDFVINSLIQLIEDGTYDGFTRDNNVRQKLANNVSVDEVKNILKREFNIDNKMYHFDLFLYDFVEEYIDKVLKDNLLRKR